VSLPLETERGYHLELARPSVQLRMPIIDKTRSFALTPMADGLRLAGTVEIAGLEAPPNERRAIALRRGAEALFPGLTAAAQRMWMGFRPTLPDSVPAIGPAPGRPGLMMAVGHGHTGMIGGPRDGASRRRDVDGRATAHPA
jgi:D-amino-acid dehydrogenase